MIVILRDTGHVVLQSQDDAEIRQIYNAVNRKYKLPTLGDIKDVVYGNNFKDALKSIKAKGIRYVIRGEGDYCIIILQLPSAEGPLIGERVSHTPVSFGYSNKPTCYADMSNYTIAYPVLSTMSHYQEVSFYKPGPTGAPTVVKLGDVINQIMPAQPVKARRR